ncbi:unnamed protein product [Calypogeia fissa]
MGRRKMKSFKSPSPTSSLDAAKQSSENIMHVDGEADNESMAVEGPVVAEGSLTVPAAHVVEPTSSDYYFDSYAHFGEFDCCALIPFCFQDDGHLERVLYGMFLEEPIHSGPSYSVSYMLSVDTTSGLFYFEIYCLSKADY